MSGARRHEDDRKRKFVPDKVVSNKKSRFINSYENNTRRVYSATASTKLRNNSVDRPDKRRSQDNRNKPNIKCRKEFCTDERMLASHQGKRATQTRIGTGSGRAYDVDRDHRRNQKDDSMFRNFNNSLVNDENMGQYSGHQEQRKNNKQRRIGYNKLKDLSSILDPNQLIVMVKADQESLKELLLDMTHLEKQDWIEHILNIFSLCSKSTMELNKKDVFGLLSDYLYQVSKKIVILEFRANVTHKIGEYLMHISNEYMRLFEDKIMDVPLETFKMFINNHIDENEELLAEVDRMITYRTVIINERNQERKNLQKPKSFRNLSTLPTIEDIRPKPNNHLRPIPTQGRFKDGEDYLDIQFRLLREDLVSPLRDGILEIKRNVSKNERKQNLGIYTGVRVEGVSYANIGLTHKMQFDIKRLKRVNWQQSKRLMNSNLLCFSKDNFTTMIFGVVAVRKAEDLENGIIEVRFLDLKEFELYFNKDTVMTMVESNVYFEAYKHVLNCFKKMDADNIPFQDYIVYCKTKSDERRLPKYLKHRDEANYKLTGPLGSNGRWKRFNILNNFSWEMNSDTLNPSQFKAFKAALTNEFTVIQGPPGCGKTYLGIRIVDALLQNKTFWDDTDNICSPNLSPPPVNTFSSMQEVPPNQRSLDSLEIIDALYCNLSSPSYSATSPTFNPTSLTHSTTTLTNLLDMLIQNSFDCLKKVEAFCELRSPTYSSLSSSKGQSSNACNLFSPLQLPVIPSTTNLKLLSQNLVGNPISSELKLESPARNLELSPLTNDSLLMPYVSQINQTEQPMETLSDRSCDQKQRNDSLMSPPLYIEVFPENPVSSTSIVTFPSSENPDLSKRTEAITSQIPQIPKFKPLFQNQPNTLTTSSETMHNYLKRKTDRNQGELNAYKNSPMLIVCYTNHALDQFLEGLVELGYKNLMRLGGRVNEKLSKFSLYEKRRSENIKGKNGRRKNAYLRNKQNYNFAAGAIKRRRREVAEELLAANVSHNFNEGIVEGRFIQHFEYKSFMTAEQFNSMNEKYGICEALNFCIFDLFLEISGFNSVDLIRFHENQYMQDNSALSSYRSNEDIDEFHDDDNSYQPIISPCEREQMLLNNGKSIGRKQGMKEKLQGVIIMTKQEYYNVINVWKLHMHDRWRLYKYWLHNMPTKNGSELDRKRAEYEILCQEIQEINDQQDEYNMRNADIIAMTTTCAAKNRHILMKLKPRIVIVEEAAEVLEAHVISSLTSSVEHLILIGDHKQLKPKPSVYDLAKRYHLDLSLFERMVNNGIELFSLDTQHRMRPEISRVLKPIYPNLIDARKVESYPDVKGIEKNLFFLNHNKNEDKDDENTSKSNDHEADFIRCLSRYLLQQGYKGAQITVISGYTGQISTLQKVMPKSGFDGITITSIDNYQGEENDIVLLSLVRSNRQGKVGFMKNENRACVALSRAKIGLYVIGNFDLFVNQKPESIWKRIIDNAKTNGCYGNKLTLYCSNHPDEKTVVSKEMDFNKILSATGCKQECKFQLRCGHFCKRPCHVLGMDHQDAVCQDPCEFKPCDIEGHQCIQTCHYGDPCKPCRVRVKKVHPKCKLVQKMACSQIAADYDCEEKCIKRLACGHPCKDKCFRKCSVKKCMEMVYKILPCSHFVTIECSRTEIDCKAMVKKELVCGHSVRIECSKTPGCCKTKVKKELLCGHAATVECFKPERSVLCMVPCAAVLQCGHPCSGKCSDCSTGRLHVKCNVKCERVLICSHICKEPCTIACPPCSIECEVRCRHSKCKRKCGDPCVECRMNCQWRCKHKRCTKKCFDICDREPCNEPCKRRLRCRHLCIGLCGEVCPPQCRKCNKEIFFGKEDNPKAKFILLNECKHIIEVNAMDMWMGMNSKVIAESGQIKLKDCPKCHTVIKISDRYRNILKRQWKDVSIIKRKILTVDRHDTDEVKSKLEKKLQELNLNITDVEYFTGSKPAMKNMAAELQSRLKKAKRVLQLNELENKLNLIEELVQLDTEYNHKLDETELAYSQLENLKSFIMRRFINDDQQLGDAADEIRRLKLYFSLLYAKDFYKTFRSGYKQPKEIEEEKKQMEEIHLLLLGKKKIPKIEDEITKLRDIEKRRGIATRLKEKERKMIVKALGLTSGYWFKCANGHYYSIGEYGGATEKSNCPECNAVIGGSNHQLAAGNQHASAFDNSAAAAWADATIVNY